MRSTEAVGESARLRVLIAGGGTGGHVIPALAIARELRDSAGAEMRFVGTARGLETAAGAGGRVSSGADPRGPVEECEPDDAGADAGRSAAGRAAVRRVVAKVPAGCRDRGGWNAWGQR